jgi:hypothetical protein
VHSPPRSARRLRTAGHGAPARRADRRNTLLPSFPPNISKADAPTATKTAFLFSLSSNHVGRTLTIDGKPPRLN